MFKEMAFDYDNCIYFMSRDVDSEMIKFSFKCNCTKQILANGGQEMLDDLYKGKHIIYLSLIDFLLPPSELIEEYDLTLGIDTSKFPKTQSRAISYLLIVL
jgi:hypothetical protein